MIRLTRYLPLILMISIAASADPLGSSFSYRGYLEASDVPVNTPVDLEFALFDAAGGGSTIAPVLAFDDVPVHEGSFTLALDFGNAPFAGDQVWLEVRVRDAGSTDSFTTLSPRQEIQAVPYALHAQYVGAGSVSSVEIVDGSIRSRDLQPGAVTTTVLADGSVAPEKLSFVPGDISAVVAGTGLVGGANSGVAELSLDPAALPPTISGRCTTGETLVGINADGTLACELLPVGLHRQTGAERLIGVDSSGRWVFQDRDVRTGSEFLGSTVCEDVLCQTRTGNLPVSVVGTIDQGPLFVIQSPGPATDRETLFGVYRAQADFELFVGVSCSDTACTTATKRNISRVRDGRSGFALAAREGALDGAAIVSYVTSAGELRVYDCDDRSCTTGTERTLASGAAVGTAVTAGSLLGTALALSDAGNPVILFGRPDPQETVTEVDLWSFVCDEPRCLSGSELLIDDTTYASAGFNNEPFYQGSDGLLRFVVNRSTFNGIGFNSFRQLFRCVDLACSGWTEVTEGAIGGIYATGADGQPITLSTTSQTGTYILTQCADSDCVNSTPTRFSAPLDDVSWLRVLPNGRPVLFTSGALYVCPTASCG